MEIHCNKNFVEKCVLCGVIVFNGIKVEKVRKVEATKQGLKRKMQKCI